MLVRCASDAISVTTAPNTRWMSCDRITSDFWVTSSPCPSSTAAEVSSQEVSIPRILAMLLGSLAQQAIDERSCVGRIPIRGLHQLFSDDAVAPDDERLRIAGNVVRFGDLPPGIVENLEGQPVLAGERPDRRLGSRIVDAYCYDLQPLRPVSFVQRLDARHLHPTRQAPCRPDVDHEDLAAVIGERFPLRN